MTKQLKRVRIVYEVLMPVDSAIGVEMNLSDIHLECMQGEWSGKGYEVIETEVLDGQDACEAACRDHGTDLEFFFEEDDDGERDDGRDSSEDDDEDEEGADPDPAAGPTITL